MVNSMTVLENECLSFAAPLKSLPGKSIMSLFHKPLPSLKVT